MFWKIILIFIVVCFFIGLSNKENRTAVYNEWFRGSFIPMLFLSILLGIFVYWFLVGIQTSGEFCNSPNKPDDIIMKLFCK